MINININIENSDKAIKEIRESLQTLASCIVKLYEWCRNGKAQQDALQKINQAIQDSFVHKGGAEALLNHFETAPITAELIEDLKHYISWMLDSLEQIKDLLHDIPDLDPMLAKEGSQHVQNCILVFRQYDSINEQRLRTGDAAQIILAIIEFSNKGNELIRGYKKSMNDFRTV